MLLQKRVIRIINLEAYDAHGEPTFKELELLTFFQVCLFHLGGFFYHTGYHLFQRVNEIHAYNTWNLNFYSIPRTNIRQFSVTDHSVNLFNSI